MDKISTFLIELDKKLKTKITLTLVERAYGKSEADKISKELGK